MAPLFVKPVGMKRRHDPDTERWIQLVGYGVLAGIVLGILIHMWSQPLVFVREAQAQTTEEVVAPKVLIEVKYNWTKERIEQEVNKVFYDAPIMIKVMRCEGGYKTDAYNPTNGSGDKGLFQVSTKYHGHRVKALKLDMNNPIDNIKYARMLYDESGLQSWRASRECWSK